MSLEFYKVFIPVLVIAYILYNYGYMSLGFFYGLSRTGFNLRNSSKATFTSCTGIMRRVINFKENKIYNFNLDYKISSGDLSIDILDNKKNQIVTLDKQNKIFDIDVNNKKKYIMIIHLKKCSGSYKLNWN